MMGLLAVGIATIYVVGHPDEPSPASDAAELAGYWKKQLVFAVVGAAGFVAANLVNYRRLGAVSHWIYLATVLLLAVILLGKYVSLPFVPLRGGAHRWIVFRIGSHSLPAIQPRSSASSPTFWPWRGICVFGAITAGSALFWVRLR